MHGFLLVLLQNDCEMGKARVSGRSEEQLRRDKLNAAKIVREVYMLHAGNRLHNCGACACAYMW